MRGWLEGDFLHSPLPITDSVGFLVRDEDTYFALAQSLGMVPGDILKIPHGMAIDIDIVGEVEAEMT